MQVVSIIPGGSKTKVTDGNKMDYLNQLAQYILGKCVAEEIESFLKGINHKYMSVINIMMYRTT